MAELRGAGRCDRLLLRGTPPVEMPGVPLSSLSRDGVDALWLGPDEWLLLTPEGQGAALAERIGRGGADHALFDVSHRQDGFVLTGEDAALLLNGAVPLDLSQAAFPVGLCARTLFDQAEIVLWRTGPAAWRIEAARSFVPYVTELFAAMAAAEGKELVRV